MNSFFTALLSFHCCLKFETSITLLKLSRVPKLLLSTECNIINLINLGFSAALMYESINNSLLR